MTPLGKDLAVFAVCFGVVLFCLIIQSLMLFWPSS